MANRTIRTPQKKAKLIAALYERPSIAYAIKKARIARSTFYDWYHAEPTFRAEIDEAIEQGLDALEDALIERGLENDTTAAIFMLKSRRRHIYGEKATVNVNVTIREKAEKVAAELGVTVDEIMAEAESIAAGAWDAAWSPE